MTTIKNGTRRKLNGGVLFICGLVTFNLIMAVGVGAALDQTSTATHSSRAISTGLSRTVQDVSAKPAALSAKANVLNVPTDYATIQAAVNAATPGDDIKVEAGVYNENVVISTSGIRLRSHHGAVIDGAGLTGTGILVLGTATQRVADVEVSGFEVRDFQRGIVLQLTVGARIIDNDIHDNNKSPFPPANLEQAAGVDLFMANSSDVTRNSIHNNGAAGIQLRLGSTNNELKDNRIFENGALLSMDMSGRGVLVTGAGTTDNEIRSNTVLRNFGRGILISRPTTPPITGNLVLKNTLHENQRCGICIMGAAQDNIVLKNDATGNNLSNNGSGLAPCLTFNLFDESPVDNTWRKNRGTSNF